jgi:acyl-CoA reductase-like NAD-dependent aldehyde dehydrogenase
MSTETIITISPTTNQPVIQRAGLSEEQLASLPAIGQEAFRHFSESTTLAQRQEIVARALGILENKKDDLAKELTMQMGRPIAYTPSEITTAIKRGNYLNRISGELLGEEEAIGSGGIVQGEPEIGFKRFIKRKPVGVVLVIFAWNVSNSLSFLPVPSLVQFREFSIILNP